MKSDPRLTLQQLLQYGIRLVEENQPEAARPFFEKALERDPGNIPALMWLAGLGETPADSYTYIARATTPGTFVVPPAKAEEMYSPEVFGRSGSDWVVVETK